MKLEELKEKAGNNGIVISQEMLEQFDEYAKLLIEVNKHMNLTAITDYEEIVEKHFFDSLLPLAGTDLSGKVCDVGSGAGFPGLVWAIVRRDLTITLLEPTGKRCDFLNQVITKLSLSNVTVVNKRAEDYAKEKRESFDCVTARAVANLRILSELCLPLLKVGGLFLALKGAKGKEEAIEAKHALAELGAEIIKEEDASLINGEKRVNLYIKKGKTTPVKYPRNYGQIKKKPL